MAQQPALMNPPLMPNATRNPPRDLSSVKLGIRRAFPPVTSRIAVRTGSDDVRYAIATAPATGNQVLSRALQADVA